MPIIIPRRSSLGFPGGQATFDLTHMSGVNRGPLQAIGITSGIPSGGGFYNLMSGKPFTAASSPTAAFYSTIGPCVSFASSGQNCSITQSANSALSCTMAAIIRFTALGAGYQTIFTNGSNLLSVHNSNLVWFNGVDTGAIALVANVPYFVALSLIHTPTLNFWVMIATNLNTGQIKNSTGSTASGTTFGTTLTIGNNAGDGTQFINGVLGPVMCAQGTGLTLQQMMGWAANPWSYWYQSRFAPSVDLELVGISAATFKAAWALNRNFINQGGVAT